MSGSAIVVIGGGGNRTQTAYGTPYPITAGDAIENTATSGPDQYCIFTNSAMVTEDVYVSPGEKYTFIESGAVVVVQP